MRGLATAIAAHMLPVFVSCNQHVEMTQVIFPSDLYGLLTWIFLLYQRAEHGKSMEAVQSNMKPLSILARLCITLCVKLTEMTFSGAAIAPASGTFATLFLPNAGCTAIMNKSSGDLACAFHSSKLLLEDPGAVVRRLSAVTAANVHCVHAHPRLACMRFETRLLAHSHWLL